MIYGKLYDISWFVSKGFTIYCVILQSTDLAQLTSILRITIWTNNYFVFSWAYYFIYISFNNHFYWRAMFFSISWRSNWEATFPRQTFLRPEFIAERYLTGKLHHANAFRLPLAFSNLSWRCKLYNTCLCVHDMHLFPFSTIWKVIQCIP